MKNYVKCLIFAVSFCFGLTAKIPSNIQTCSQSNKNFNVCLRDAIQDAVVKFKDGIPSLKIPSLDPIHVPSMTIGEGEGAVHVTQHYNNIKIYGSAKSNVTKVDGSKIKEFKLYTESVTPSLRLEGQYNISGRILLLPITGNGDCVITLYDAAATHDIIGEKLEKNGEIYMKVTRYDLTLHPSKVEYNLKNLFNGDERLGREMNNILNENWKEVFEDVKEGYEEAFGTIFKDFADKFFSRVPFKDIFLD